MNTYKYFGGGLDSLKARLSCQDGKSLRRVENGRYNFQIITFIRTYGPVIADAETSTKGFQLVPFG
jgi:hypothetical protein